ncbi:PREDICTED: solute carrier family 17 member 9 [Nanorana parkeri]|uniref:solute carrier family 17 member 9 n=1 Tax=Nanorana parkeri TaxID=125878 RepID=UPI000854D3BA|nr:PREDICTED: solute carrier family 17 member 9 [Nanorana parkeri]
MATKGGKNGYKSDVDLLLKDEQLQSPPRSPQHGDRTKKPSGDQHWSECEARVWMFTLLAGTCFLYCARSSLPICAVSMSEQFGWNKKQTGLALSSFFWGYCLTQIAGGHLSDKVGGERVLLVSALLWGLITIATPLAAHATTASLHLVSFLRFLMGLLQGVHFPALSSVFAKRVRDKERGFFCSFVGCGSQCGTLLIGGAGSLLQDWYGWEYVFYFAGFLALAWTYCLGTYILKEKNKFLFSDLSRSFTTSAKTNIPWRHLLKKAPVWAVIVGQVSVASSAFTLFSWVPIFFKNRFPESKGLVFNVVPWLIAIPAALMSGRLTDHLIKTGYKPIFVRKLMEVIGMGMSSIFIFLLGQSGSFSQAMVFISVAVALQTFNHSGLTINIQDLAPSCSGFLFGVANTGGSVFGILWVYLSGYLLDVTGSWDSMFHLLVAVNVLGLLFYLEFAKTERMDIDSALPVLRI